MTELPDDPNSIDEEIDQAISDLTEDDLTRILVITAEVIEGLVDPTEELDSWDVEAVQRAAMRSFVAGYLSGRSEEPQQASTDLLVGITPEDAATIVAGLLGDGATITLGVIRQG
jgi:hypothetical protein